MIWIGTEYGLNKLDLRKKEISHYISDPSDPLSLSCNIIMGIYEDQFGTLWITTYGGGLNKFDRTKGQFIHFKHDPNNLESISNDYAGAVYEDRSGNLWIGTLYGLNIYDRKQGIFIQYKNNPDNTSSIGGNFISVIYEDQKEIIWVGTVGAGLNRFNRKDNSFMQYKNDPLNPESISDNNIHCILEDKEEYGILWIGTRNGLNKLYRTSDTFIHYKKKDGLANNIVQGILQDNQGNLWISTINGLSKFNPQSETFCNYDENDGLQSKEFKAGAYLKSRKGQFFFGGINGVNYFYPDKIVENNYIPPIVFSDFQIFGQSVNIGGDSPLKKHISEAEKIVLSYKQNPFTFEFAALDFHHPQKNKYAYMLEGQESDWIMLGNKRHITFSDLEPGDYTLRAKGTNNDGLWNDKGISIEIVILPPPWRTIWFRIILGALISILIMISLISWKKYRLSQAKKQWDLSQICSESNISKREKEIIELVIRGKTNKEIADELYISTKTVKYHLYNVFQKMGVKNRLQLINSIRLKSPEKRY
jgi:DNA-binding CsgD family transcriptional regulator